MPALVGAARRPDVDVDISLWRPEHPVPGLADPQDVPGALELVPEARLVVGVVHRDQDVDDGLGGETRYRRRADVLDASSARTESAVDRLALRLEARRPRRRVVDDLDDPFLPATDEDGIEVPVEIVRVSAAGPGAVVGQDSPSIMAITSSGRYPWRRANATSSRT